MNNQQHQHPDLLTRPILFQPGAEIIHTYFDNLSTTQQARFNELGTVYQAWNARLNLISRQDLPNLYLRHVLHALSIAKVIHFKPGTRILDVGTGGGFPGIPLAILFPDVSFHLVDSIGKKLHAVQAIAQALHLANVTTQVVRAEQLTSSYDFILGRAVTQLDVFYQWVRDKVAAISFNELPNGVLYLKGNEPAQIKQPQHIYHLNRFFEEPFFETKQLVYIAHLPYDTKKGATISSKN
jgi:16S rRNA (guanine527-N7)-methyltransferase